MNWIPVTARVPEDRRRVLIWGYAWLAFAPGYGNPGFMGETRFNPSKEGGKFDTEIHCWRDPVIRKVTHWAEIEGPK
jgi:hypothetical protein